MKRQEGPVSIERLDQQRMTVSGTLGDRDLGAVCRRPSGAAQDAYQCPMAMRSTLAANTKSSRKRFRELTIAAIMALMLVYMVMAAQFESLRDPFIILFSIPLAAIGVVLTLVLTGTTFNMQAFLGVIMLIGIVVNNAIVLIDYTIQLRRDHGYELDDASRNRGDPPPPAGSDDHNDNGARPGADGSRDR